MATIEIDANTKADQKATYRATIRGFGQRDTKIRPIDKGQIGTLARFVLDSFIPGRAPVIAITITGHADSDPTRHTEESISAGRAANVKMEFLQDVIADTFPLKLPSPWNNILWDVTGVGASQPDEKKLGNGRVVVDLATDDPTTKSKFILTREQLQDILDVNDAPSSMAPPNQPPQPWFKPIPPRIPAKHATTKWIKKVQANMTLRFGDNWKGNFDASVLSRMAADILGDPTVTPADFLKSWYEQEKERQTSEQNPIELDLHYDPQRGKLTDDPPAN